MNKKITLKEFKKSIKILLPEINIINEELLEYLWIHEFYDGPINGILKYKNKEYRYEMVTDYTKLMYPRIFAIIAINDDELKEEIYWNDLYEKLVKNKSENKESSEIFFKLQKKRKAINYENKIVLWYFTQK